MGVYVKSKSASADQREEGASEGGWYLKKKLNIVMSYGVNHIIFIRYIS